MTSYHAINQAMPNRDPAGGVVVIGVGGVGHMAVTILKATSGSQVLVLAESKRIQTRIEKFPLGQIQSAYDKLEEGQIVGRAVIIP